MAGASLDQLLRILLRLGKWESGTREIYDEFRNFRAYRIEVSVAVLVQIPLNRPFRPIYPTIIFLRVSYFRSESTFACS